MKFLNTDHQRKTCIQSGILVSLMFVMFWGGNRSIASLTLSVMSTPTVTLDYMSEQHLAWSEVPLSADFRVNDCTFTSPTDGWAVGEKGKILHWDGKNWISFQSPLPDDLTSLKSVEMLSPDDGWAVGIAGEMIHWNGTEWIKFPFVTDNDLETVSLVNSDFGFSGGKGSFGGVKPDEGVILQWNGAQWNKIYFPPPKQKDQVGIFAIQMISKQEGWAAGNGQLYRWNGYSWQAYYQGSEKEPLFSTLFSFSALNANNIWASGWNTYKDGYAGVILHWDGNVWKEAYRTQSGGEIIDYIQMISPRHGWALGHVFDSMTYTKISFLLHWDGIRWSDFPLPTYSSITSFCAIDQNRAWLFGETTIRDRKGSVTGYNPIVFFLSEVPISKVTPASASTLAPHLVPTSYPSQIVASRAVRIMVENPTIQANSATLTEQPSSGRQDQIQTNLLVLIGVILAAILLAFIYKMKLKER